MGQSAPTADPQADDQLLTAKDEDALVMRVVVSCC